MYFPRIRTLLKKKLHIGVALQPADEAGNSGKGRWVTTRAVLYTKGGDTNQSVSNSQWATRVTAAGTGVLISRRTQDGRLQRTKDFFAVLVANNFQVDFVKSIGDGVTMTIGQTPTASSGGFASKITIIGTWQVDSIDGVVQ